MKLTEGKPDISGLFGDDLLPLKEDKIELSYLSGDKPAAGGNGLVFKATDNQTGEEYAVKFCKFPQENNNPKDKLRRKRFFREIDALNKLAQEEVENVVGLVEVGEIEIGRKNWDYYIMEKCDCSLQEYLEKEPDISMQQRVYLFDKILNGIAYLHRENIYHRDIKGENILVLNNEPKICDLGLSAFRPIDEELEDAEIGEPIGPRGWFSPEATNKYLVEKTVNKHNLNCTIDAKSDVFQLGKLFWYIVQGNLPLGQIAKSDLIASKSNALYSVIRRCLIHSHKRRISLDILQKSVKDLFPEFGL